MIMLLYMIMLPYTLKRCYRWPPYIFAPVQKYKIALPKFQCYEKSKALTRLCKLSHFKMTGKSCTDKVREKVPSGEHFEKHRNIFFFFFFLNINIHLLVQLILGTQMSCLTETVLLSTLVICVNEYTEKVNLNYSHSI